MVVKVQTVIESRMDDSEVERLENLGLAPEQEDIKEELVTAYIDLNEIATVHKTYMYLNEDEIEGFRVVFKSGAKIPYVGNVDQFCKL